MKYGLKSIKPAVWGAIAAICFAMWLIPTLVGAFLSLVWFLVKLPFALLWFLVRDALGGLLLFAWELFGKFFAIFGLPGLVLKWAIVLAAVAYAALFVYNFVKIRRDK